MAQLQRINLDFSRATSELAEFKKFLQDNTTFSERKVVAELKKRPHLSCLIGFLQPSVPRADAYKFEFQIQGVFRADLVVGFNNLGFDYEVLHYYTILDLRQLPTLDILVEVRKTLPHRLGLDSIAHATMGVEKTSEGMQAIRWYKEGKLVEIAEYCCYDVKITRLVHQYGTAHKQLFYTNKFGARMAVPVNW